MADRPDQCQLRSAGGARPDCRAAARGLSRARHAAVVAHRSGWASDGEADYVSAGMSTSEVVIVEAVRTPIGRRNGGLSTMHPADLLARSSRRSSSAPASTRPTSTRSSAAASARSASSPSTSPAPRGSPPGCRSTSPPPPSTPSAARRQQATNLAAALVGVRRRRRRASPAASSR